MRHVLLISIAALGLAACTSDSDPYGVTYVETATAQQSLEAR